MKPALSKNIQVARITQPEQREAAIKVLRRPMLRKKTGSGVLKHFFR